SSASSQNSTSAQPTSLPSILSRSLNDADDLLDNENIQILIVLYVQLQLLDNIEGSDVGCADVEFYDDADDCVQREGSYK
ncbi:MAG: hypothetical protein EZS28_049423, partial [Streblomastix strix]